jgi:sporulation protein YlmC with PRC-barrel domain
MGAATPFAIGADASCSDGACGQLTAIVVNPIAREVTHLMIGPAHRGGVARLVPADLVTETAGDLRLDCTLAEFEQLRPAQESEFVPGSEYLGYPGYGPSEVHCQPFRGLGGPSPARTVRYDSVPVGEVEVRRGETVYATDGEIGQVQGLAVESDGHHVTHVLLAKRHLLGHIDVAVPISAVTKVGGIIELSMSSHQVQDLPRVDLDHPAG